MSVAADHGQRTSDHHQSSIEDRKFLDGRFTLRISNPKSKIQNTKYEVSFEVASYDPTKPLIIDPVLSFSTFLGGSGADGAWGMALDSSGNLYVTGGTISSDFPIAGSPFQRSFGGAPLSTCTDIPAFCGDAFVTKLNSTGTALIYSTYLGGSGDEVAGLTLDSSGDVFVAGITSSSNFPTTAGAFDTTCGTDGTCNTGLSDAFVAELSGLVMPVVTLSPTSLDLGSIGVGFTSTGQAVTLTNAGDGNLFPSISTTGDFRETDNCFGFVAPQSNCTITVTFTPTAVGTRTGSLTITDNAAGSPQTVSLTGIGVAAPAATLSTFSLTFPDQVINTTSAAQAVMLTNTGTAPMTISGIATSGDFAQSNNCPVSPSTLAIGANCTINVTFTPTIIGTDVGSLNITDNAPGSPQSVTLTGKGLSAGIIGASAMSLDFGTQSVGTTSASKAVTLTNTGTGPLGILSIQTTPPFAQTNTCGGSIAAGASCEIDATLTPTVLGPVSGTLTIVHDAAGSPATVALTGTGTAAIPATATAWDIASTIGATPDASVADATGVTQHVATAANPLTIVTVIDNASHPGGACGIIFWNPVTNAFKWYGVGGGFQSGTDVNRTAPVKTDTSAGKTFQPGDAWGTNSSCPGLFMNFKGSNDFRSYHDENGANINAFGVTVDQASGNLWFTEGGAGQISLLDPATNQVTRFTTGGNPAYIAVDSAGRAYTAAKASGSTGMDEIVRVNASSGEVVRWTIPTSGALAFLSGTTSNGISIDASGDVWFAESSANKIGRLSSGSDGVLGTADDQICEYTKGGISNPQLVANTGSGSTAQVFFSEGTGLAVSVLTPSAATPTCATVVPTISTVTPATPKFTTVDFTELNGATGCPCGGCASPGTATLTPTTQSIAGVDPSGINRFLLSSASVSLGITSPSGMTGVVLSGTVFGSDISGNHVFEVQSAAITGPVVALSSTNLSFPDTGVGSTSAAQTVTLTNSGTAPLNVTNIMITGDFAETNTCGTSLAAGANCTISVTFTPTVTGSRTGAITITDDAAGSPHVVDLTGIGFTGPALTLSTTSLTLPDTHINQTCHPQTVTVTNTGTGALTISSIAVTAGEFSVSATTCPLTPATLAAGANCTISVVFHPTKLGVQSGTLSITSDAPGSPHTVALSGNGLPPCLLMAVLPTVEVVKGSDAATFTVFHDTKGQAADPIRLTCLDAAPAACSLTPEVIEVPERSTMRVTNLRLVSGSSKGFTVKGDSAGDHHELFVQVLFSDFSFTPFPSVATVDAGRTASYALSIVPVNGLAGQVTLSCAGAPRGARCTVEPSSVNLTKTPVEVQVKVTTTSQGWAPLRVTPDFRFPTSDFRFFIFLWSLLLLLGASVAIARKKAWLGMATAMLAVAVWAGCGGGGMMLPGGLGGGTPSGTFSLVVTGTFTPSAGTTAQDPTAPKLTHDVTLTLKVN